MSDETQQVAVRDLRPGDQVDLESCPYLNKDPLAEYEYAVVDEVEEETPNCLVVHYTEHCAAYSPDTVLTIKKRGN